MLTRPENHEAFTDLPEHWINAEHGKQPPKSITLDMDTAPRAQRTATRKASLERPLPAKAPT